MSDQAMSPPIKVSTTPQNASPFLSLFLSATRPLPSDTAVYPPYFILFQHTKHFSQRILAAEPDSSSQIYRNAGLLTPKESSIKDSSGDLFIQEAWKECVTKCSGRVILVKCCDSLDFGLEHGEGGKERRHPRDKNIRRMFLENGVTVDFFSDPLGWDCDDVDEPPCRNTGHTIKGNISKLHSILSYLQDAADYIARNQQSTQPIPIIFDSLTPLILHHGVEKLSILFTALKQQTHNKNAVLSPIFLPVLSEMLSPSKNRVLEEYADAVLTLHGGKMSIAKRSARNGGMISGGFSGGLRLVKDVQYFEVKNYPWSELIWTKGGGGGGQEAHVNEQNATNPTEKDLEDVSQDMKKVTMSSVSQKSDKSVQDRTKKRPVLMHENDNNRHHDNQQSENRPRPVIYLEDNDPEFQDLDEEDPDDDLDI